MMLDENKSLQHIKNSLCFFSIDGQSLIAFLSEWHFQFIADYHIKLL